ncbi:MAG: 30S ribosomal protein S6 [Bdellovibrionales bacterium]|nr:30S ribosomal protein S6 [Bdellovibrionales bacterium]
MDLTVEKPLRKYETVIILHPDVNEQEQKNFFKRNQDTIKHYDGEINHIDTWGKRKLANPIEKIKLGTYFHSTFEANSDCVAELERLMKIDERVLRYIHVRLDDRNSLADHVSEFHAVLAESIKREQEKEAKNQARRMAMSGRGGPRDRGDRDGRDSRDSGYASRKSAIVVDDDSDGDSSEEN